MLKKVKYEISHNKHYFVIRFDQYSNSIKITSTYHDDGTVEDTMMSIPIKALYLFMHIFGDIQFNVINNESSFKKSISERQEA